MKKLFQEKYYPFVIVVFAFVLYANTLPNKYAFDDKLATPIHQQVQKGIKAIPEIFSSYYVTGYDSDFEYRPLAKSTFAIEYSLFGKNPLMSHLINVLLYCFTCFLLYKLILLIFPANGKLFAFIAILLFAAHPTHTEAVSSLKNREEILTFLFCILSTYFFVSGAKKNNYYLFIPATVFFAVTLFTKLTSLPFLLIIPLCIYFSGEKKLKLPLFAFVSLISLFGTFYFTLNKFLPGVHHREMFFIENPVIIENSLFVKILNALQTMWLYLKLYIFPHPLSFYYGYNVFPIIKKISPEIVVAFLVYGFMFVYSILKIKKRNVVAFAFLFYLLNMSMYCNPFYPAPGIIADRALYVSSLGFSLLLSFFIARLSTGKMILISVLLLLPASIKTIARNSDWKDNFTLMSNDIKHLQHSAKANLEFAALLKEKWENNNDAKQKENFAQKAIFHFQQALNVKPDMAIPNNEIGEILFNQYGKQAEAKEYFLRAVELLDSRAEYHFNLATAHAFLNEFEEAEKHFLKTMELEPNYTKAIHNLFLVYMSQSRWSDAFKINSMLMEKIPNEAHPHFNFGQYFLALDDTAKALENFDRAIQLKPADESLRNFVASIRGK